MCTNEDGQYTIAITQTQWRTQIQASTIFEQTVAQFVIG
jgi:hypothetical protein